MAAAIAKRLKLSGYYFVVPGSGTAPESDVNAPGGIQTVVILRFTTRRGKLRAANMKLRFYDAHNHLQDDRFGGRQTELLATCREVGVVRMVVNGA